MKRNVASVCLIALLAGTAGAAAAGIGFRIGDVSIGYSDGYWDHAHHWHHWRAGELARFRHARASAYHNWRHDDRRHH